MYIILLIGVSAIRIKQTSKGEEKSYLFFQEAHRYKGQGDRASGQEIHKPGWITDTT